MVSPSGYNWPAAVSSAAKAASDITTVRGLLGREMASWLTAWGEPVLLGPGSIHVAHTPDEKLAKAELAEAIELYVKVAQGLVGQV